MESAFYIKLVAILKWLLPASVGSAIAVSIGPKYALAKAAGMFIAGVAISGYGGGAIIAHYQIEPGPIQAFIYLAIGLWGLGAVIAITKELPGLVKGLTDKWLK